MASSSDTVVSPFSDKASSRLALERATKSKLSPVKASRTSAEMTMPLYTSESLSRDCRNPNAFSTSSPFASCKPTPAIFYKKTTPSTITPVLNDPITTSPTMKVIVSPYLILERATGISDSVQTRRGEKLHSLSNAINKSTFSRAPRIPSR